MARCRVRDLDGKTRAVERHSPVKGKDRTGAQAERHLIDHLENRTAPARAGLTASTPLRDVWTYHRARLVKKARAQRTLDNYDLYIRYVLEELGDVRVEEMNSPMVSRTLNLIGEQHGQNPMDNCRTLISSMFKTCADMGAVRQDVRPWTYGLDLPRRKRRRKQSLTASQMSALYDAVWGSRLLMTPVGEPTRYLGETVSDYCVRRDVAGIVTFMLGTGTRIGETLGVRWIDIDLDGKVVTIAGQTHRDSTGVVRRPYTKTGEAREISLPDFVVTMLRDRKRSGYINTEGVVFGSASCGLRAPGSFHHAWDRVRTVLGFEWVTSHTFRRSLLTVLDDAGLSARAAADVAGHANISMTTDVYLQRGRVHVAAANAVNKVVSGGVPKSSG